MWIYYPIAPSVGPATSRRRNKSDMAEHWSRLVCATPSSHRGCRFELVAYTVRKLVLFFILFLSFSISLIKYVVLSKAAIVPNLQCHMILQKSSEQSSYHLNNYQCWKHYGYFLYRKFKAFIWNKIILFLYCYFWSNIFSLVYKSIHLFKEKVLLTPNFWQ